MDKSIEEQIKQLNIISPLKAILSGTEIKNGSLISKEIIRIEKDGKIEEADVALTFVAGEAKKPFVAYTVENADDKTDDYRVTVDIEEVVFTEDGYYLVAPSEEDHRNIVVPAIVAIGNATTEDHHELAEIVKSAINDPNFSIISLNTVGEYVEKFEEQYNNAEQKDNIFFKVKSSIQVVIPAVKLRKIKKQYIKEVSEMYATAKYDIKIKLTADEIQQKLDENNDKYYEVGALIDQFNELNDKTNSQKFDKDINELVDLQDALDDARNIYLKKQAKLEKEDLQNEVVPEEQLEEINEVQEETDELETPEVIASEVIPEVQLEEMEESVISGENVITVESPVMFEEKIVDEPVQEESAKEETAIMEQFVDKNEGIEKMTEEIVAEQQSELIIKEEEDALKEQVEARVQKFNEEMEDFKQQQSKQYDEKYTREQDALLKSVRNTYEEYIRKLRTGLTDTLDKCILEANNSINGLKTANENLKTSLATTEKSLKEEKADNESLRRTINEKDSEINVLKSKEQEYDKQSDEQKIKIDSLEKANKAKDEKISGLEFEARREETNKEKLNVELKTKDSKINELNANLVKAEEKNNSYKEQLGTISKNMDDIRNEYNDYKIKADKEIEMLKAQVNSYKSLMANMKSLQESMSQIAEGYGNKEEKEEAKKK